MKIVLIVDDEKNFLSSLEKGLTAFSEEFQIITAENGAAALTVLNSYPVDLVVTDLKMPVMDGFALIAEMMKSFQFIPVIVMTAFGTHAMEEKLLESGIFDIFEKPIDFPSLAERIQAGLTRPSKRKLKGITLFGFLKLLELEQKTCSLKVTSHNRSGMLYFSKGQLVNGTYGSLEGEPAVFEIVSWDQPEIEFPPLLQAAQPLINLPISDIYIEAALLKEERAGALEAAPMPPEPPPGSPNVEFILARLARLDGTIAVMLVDQQTGHPLGVVGNTPKPEATAAGNSTVVRAKLKVMRELGLKDSLEDILISLESQYHLIRPLSTHPNLFLYLILDRSVANLALARHQLAEFADQVEL